LHLSRPVAPGRAGCSRRAGGAATVGTAAGPVDEGVDRELGLDLREVRGRGGLAEVDGVDREQAAVRASAAVADVDEVPQAVEEVRELVEVALELDLDRESPRSRRADGGARGVICWKVMPLSSATWLSSSRMSGISAWSGIAFVRRKMSATRICAAFFA
jgi:hypothetical protein